MTTTLQDVLDQIDDALNRIDSLSVYSKAVVREQVEAAQRVLIDWVGNHCDPERAEPTWAGLLMLALIDMTARRNMLRVRQELATARGYLDDQRAKLPLYAMGGAAW